MSFTSFADLSGSVQSNTFITTHTSSDEATHTSSDEDQQDYQQHQNLIQTLHHPHQPNQNATSSSILIDKQYWMSDATCSTCTECSLPFNVFRRRHHCRICGRIFCNKHVKTQLLAIDDSSQQTVRRKVCVGCTSILTSNVSDYAHRTKQQKKQLQNKRKQNIQLQQDGRQSIWSNHSRAPVASPCTPKIKQSATTTSNRKGRLRFFGKSQTPASNSGAKNKRNTNRSITKEDDSNSNKQEERSSIFSPSTLSSSVTSDSPLTTSFGRSRTSSIGSSNSNSKMRSESNDLIHAMQTIDQFNNNTLPNIQETSINTPVTMSRLSSFVTSSRRKQTSQQQRDTKLSKIQKIILTQLIEKSKPSTKTGKQQNDSEKNKEYYFTGSAIINILIDRNISKTRKEAIMLSNEMLHRHLLLQTSSAISKTNPKKLTKRSSSISLNAKNAAVSVLIDSTSVQYQFVLPNASSRKTNASISKKKTNLPENHNQRTKMRTSSTLSSPPTSPQRKSEHNRSRTLDMNKNFEETKTVTDINNNNSSRDRTLSVHSNDSNESNSYTDNNLFSGKRTNASDSISSMPDEYRTSIDNFNIEPHRKSDVDNNTTQESTDQFDDLERWSSSDEEYAEDNHATPPIERTPSQLTLGTSPLSKKNQHTNSKHLNKNVKNTIKNKKHVRLRGLFSPLNSIWESVLNNAYLENIHMCNAAGSNVAKANNKRYKTITHRNVVELSTWMDSYMKEMTTKEIGREKF